MRDIPYERFDGPVGTPQPVMQAVGVGAMAMTLVALGIQPLGFRKDGSPIWPIAGGANYLATLQGERQQLAGEEKAILAAIEASSGQATDTQRARLAEIDERFEGKDGKPGLNAEIAAEERRRQREADAPAVAVDEIAEKAQALAQASNEKAPTPFKSLGEQLQAVHAAAINQKRGKPVDGRLTQIMDFAHEQAAIHGASELVGSDGGFLVQTDFNNELLGEIIEGGRLASLARSIEVGANSNGVKFNVFDETSRATGSRYGGVRAYWLNEGGQKTASKPKLRRVEIELAKLAAMYVATDELLQDTTALQSVVRPAFVEEMAFQVDDAMIRGTGVGMPLGLLNADALVTVSKETGQAADTIVLENIDKMLVRVLPGSLVKSSWYINQELWPQLFNLAQVIGTGGVPAFIPPGGAGASPFGNLRGRPVVPIEQASAPGDLGDIILADWSQYVLVRKGGIQEASSIHVYFDTDETAFRWVLRINGRPWRHSSVTPYKGSGTLSPFVTLQAR